MTSDPLTFDRFWRWLVEHRNCVVRAGSGDIILMDSDFMHWDFFDEDEEQAVCQLIFGKWLVGEIIIERSGILFVQASLDVENPQSGHWVFECIGGPREETHSLYVFVTTHGFEATQGHQMLKH